MATKNQIAANRLNAKKSTGPRSPEGKARSSMNALRSGIDCETQVIKHLEEFADLNRLKMEYGDRYHPTTPAQRMLVDTLIDCEWRLRRYRRIEAEVLLHGTNNTLNQTILAASFLKTCDALARLQRHVDSAQRNFRNALHELERLQAEEATLDDDDDLAATLAIETASPENGFVPLFSLEQSPSPAESPVLSPPPAPRSSERRRRI